MTTKTYDQADIDRVYNDMTAKVRVRLRFISPYCGGQPAADDGIAAFITYQMKLEPGTKAWDGAFARIKKEEIGEFDVTTEGGERDEVSTYGINIVRRDATGPYLCVHQIKACLKQAASRAELFVKKRGSKGDLAEVSRVRPYGKSSRGHTQRVYFLDEDGDPINADSEREFDKIHGRVSTPKGQKSIVVDTEFLPEGTQAEFTFQLPLVKLTGDDILKILAYAQECGLGSARSMERGKFIVDEAEIETGAEKPAEPKKQKKPAKK